MQLSQRAIVRRAQSYLRRNELYLFMPVLPGFERVAAQELTAIGVTPNVVRGGLQFNGNLTTIYKVNLLHRTGSRVLLRVGDFLAQTYPMLYDHTKRIPWEALLGNCPTIGFRVSFHGSRLRNAQHISETLFAAISGRLTNLGLSPTLGDDPSLTVYARIVRDHCSLSLDTTGKHLHKRGYRPDHFTAPLRETTASAVLLAADADSYDCLVDPFCGSGTIPVEAALLTARRPPSRNREFAFFESPLHSAGTYSETLRLVDRLARPPKIQRIFGLDVNPLAIETARRCALNAEAETVSFQQGDALHVDLDRLLGTARRGLIATNLPYGKRLGSRSEAEHLVSAFATRLSKLETHWDLAVVTASPRAFRSHGLKIEHELRFHNGGLPVSLLLGTNQP